jgi:UDP-N-acetylglucosamine--N-acetylmuramyl-(pentapeptide) pyrophosphoryl-undecaprenol N-acetylglucosamine transferase
MADVVVARAGATTLFELLALRKPALLIPLSLGASRGDQIQNAASFARQGFSHVLAEADLTPTTLVQRLERAYAEREAMIDAMKSRTIKSRTTQAAQPINGVAAVVRVIQDALRIEN